MRSKIRGRGIMHEDDDYPKHIDKNDDSHLDDFLDDLD